MNASTSIPTADESSNPWIFRCRIHDPRAHARVLDYVFDSLGCRRPVVVHTDSRLSRMHLEWWSEHARRRGFEAVAELTLADDEASLATLIDRLEATDFDVLLTWSDASLAAALVKRLRQRGLEQAVVGSDAIVGEAFHDQAGPSPGTVVAPGPCRHREDSAAMRRIEETYRHRTSTPEELSPLACLSIDATRHLAEALAVSGGDRETLRRKLASMSEAIVVRLVDGAWRIQAPDGDP